MFRSIGVGAAFLHSESFRESSEERGTSLVEFSVILPLIVLLLFSIIQYSLIFSAYLTVHNANVIAARFATLNPDSTSMTIEQIARASLVPMLQPDNLLDPVIELNEVVGGIGGAKKVQLTYELPLLLPFVVPNATEDRTFIIRTEAVMR